MTLRERLAHLHRRLGFGATQAELDRDEKLGFNRALDRLIDYEDVNEEFDVSPYEFCWRTSEKAEADVGTYRFRAWWAFRMMATQRPLQEKLTLFWSGHFAAGDDKVEDGPMMLDYLQGLRANACGSFENLLNFVSKCPAMMRYLDMTRSLRGNPNENFAREVMELFTLGIGGGYTEKDVQEVARALTGWGYMHMMYELPGDMTGKLNDSIKYGRPFSSFTYMPVMHDPGEKTILGTTKHWTGDEVLKVLANHQSTAEFVCRKLWTFFAYEDPEPEVVEMVARTFVRTRGDINTVIRTIVRSKQFWSEKCVYQMAKSPADFVIGMARVQGIGIETMKFRDSKSDVHTQINQRIMNEAGSVAYRLDRMGLSLLVPPNVAGWNWGKAFLSPAMMAERFQYTGNYIEDKGKPDKAAQNTIGWVASKSPKTSKEAAALYLQLYGVPASASATKTLTEVIDKAGGIAAFKNINQWGGLNYLLNRVLVAAPEMHVC